MLFEQFGQGGARCWSSDINVGLPELLECNIRGWVVQFSCTWPCWRNLVSFSLTCKFSCSPLYLDEKTGINEMYDSTSAASMYQFLFSIVCGWVDAEKGTKLWCYFACVFHFRATPSNILPPTLYDSCHLPSGKGPSYLVVIVCTYTPRYIFFPNCFFFFLQKGKFYSLLSS